MSSKRFYVLFDFRLYLYFRSNAIYLFLLIDCVKTYRNFTFRPFHKINSAIQILVINAIL